MAMRINRQSLETRLIKVALIVTLLSYLPHLSQSVAYSIATGTVVLISLLLIAQPKGVSTALKLLRTSPHFWAFVFSLLASQYFVMLSGGLSIWGLIKTVAYIVVLICAYLIIAPSVQRLDKPIWSFMANLGGVLSLISMVISIRGGLSFLGLTWTAKWPIPAIGIQQTTSIFEDSNYFGVVAFLGFMASLYLLALKKRHVFSRLWPLILSSFNAIGIFLSYSRATYLALGIALLAWFLIDARLTKKITVLLLNGFLVIGGILLIQAKPALMSFFQIDKGLSGRERLFPAAISAIMERPLLGWGVGNVGYAIQHHVGHWTSTRNSFVDYLIQQGAAERWISAHNSFLDFFIMAGIPAGLIYIWFILISLKRLYWTRIHNTERRFLLSTIIGMLVLTQFTTHTIGGISFGSFMLTALLGIANCCPIAMEHGKD